MKVALILLGLLVTYIVASGQTLQTRSGMILSDSFPIGRYIGPFDIKISRFAHGHKWTITINPDDTLLVMVRKP